MKITLRKLNNLKQLKSATIFQALISNCKFKNSIYTRKYTQLELNQSSHAPRYNTSVFVVTPMEGDVIDPIGAAIRKQCRWQKVWGKSLVWEDRGIVPASLKDNRTAVK